MRRRACHARCAVRMGRRPIAAVLDQGFKIENEFFREHFDGLHCAPMLAMLRWLCFMSVSSSSRNGFVGPRVCQMPSQGCEGGPGWNSPG